jgi:hypothetical protein
MKLYKYMSGSRAARFFAQPLLRITNPNGLNDPFEFAITKKLAQEIEDVLSRNEGRDAGFVSYTNQFLSYGILSLSRTYDNLLMWSHYADEHRGAVLEFNVAESNPYELFGFDEEIQCTDLVALGAVDYRKSRPYDGPVTAESMESIRRHYVFSKSDEWIYEKEFRFVMHYALADLILVSSSELGIAFKVAGHDFEEFLKRSGVVRDGGNLWIDIQRSEIDPDMVKQMWIMTKQMNSFFFKIVDLERVSKVFLGCQHNGEVGDAIRVSADPSIRDKFIGDNGFQNIVKAFLSDFQICDKYGAVSSLCKLEEKVARGICRKLENIGQVVKVSFAIRWLDMETIILMIFFPSLPVIDWYCSSKAFFNRALEY